MLKIYEENATTFLNNGIATLHPHKSLVYKEDNGDYYIEIESPVEDHQYLQQGRIVRASTPWGWQGFRLQNPLRTARRVKVKGRHISFDSDKYAIKYASIDRKIASTALTTLNNACDAQTPFTFDGTDITSQHTYTCVNKSFTEALSSVLELWGGHLVRDNFNIALKATVGQDRGVVLAYGKNIKELEADEDWSEVCTKILPIGNDGITLDETFLESTEKYNVPYTKIVEFKQDVDKLDGETDDEHLARLKADLKTQATTYLTEHHTPKVNYKVKAHLRDVTDVGDVIRIKHPKCNIELVTNVIKVVYDTIQNKYIEVEFGNYRRTLNDLISTVTQSAVEASKKETAVVKSDLSVYLQNATDKIYQLLKDSHIIYEGDKILAVDKLPKEEATNVMMISLGGIAFSNSGINGTFTSAWTLDGTLDMSAIHVINLTADMINVTDLEAFGATIGGWSIADDCIYNTDYYSGVTFLKTTKDFYDEMSNPCIFAIGADSTNDSVLSDANFALWKNGRAKFGTLLTGRVSIDSTNIEFSQTDYGSASIGLKPWSPIVQKKKNLCINIPAQESGDDAALSIYGKDILDEGSFNPIRIAKFSYGEGTIQTNPGINENSTSKTFGSKNQYSGLIHYRNYFDSSGNHKWLSMVKFGCGGGTSPTASMECHKYNGSTYDIVSRLDVYPNTTGEASVSLKVSPDGSAYTPLEFSKNKMYYRGELWLNGWDVAACIKELYDKVSALGG